MLQHRVLQYDMSDINRNYLESLLASPLLPSFSSIINVGCQGATPTPTHPLLGVFEGKKLYKLSTIKLGNYLLYLY